jgi:hypothetical protein
VTQAHKAAAASALSARPPPSVAESDSSLGGTGGPGGISSDTDEDTSGAGVSRRVVAVASACALVFVMGRRVLFLCCVVWRVCGASVSSLVVAATGAALFLIAAFDLRHAASGNNVGAVDAELQALLAPAAATHKS